MPFDPTLDELSSEQQRQMTHQAPQPPDFAARVGQGAFGAWKNFSEPIWNAMTTPPGMTPSDLEQQARTAADLGFNLTTAGMGLGTKFGEAGALGIMGGSRGFEELAARGGSSQALSDLDLAKQMEAAGMDRSQIRAAAKWYKEGPSGIWNKEIFDYPSSLNMLEVPSVRTYLPKATTVGKVLNHPDLYNIYPHLKDMPLYFGENVLPRNEFAGYAHPGGKARHGAIIVNNPHNTNWLEMKKSILHELQHAVDKYEGRPLRESRKLTTDEYLKSIEEGRSRNTEWRSEYPEDVLMQPGMDPWKTMEKMRDPYREEQFTVPP